jgi:hypothetical protein
MTIESRVDRGKKLASRILTDIAGIGVAYLVIGKMISNSTDVDYKAILSEFAPNFLLIGAAFITLDLVQAYTEYRKNSR